jgi:hypothetical protein
VPELSRYAFTPVRERDSLFLEPTISDRSADNPSPVPYTAGEWEASHGYTDQDFHDTHVVTDHFRFDRHAYDEGR